MQPIIYSADTPSNIESDFKIDWANLITEAKSLTDEEGYDYLVEIKKYSNNGGIPTGIIGKVFVYQQDEGFEKLLSVIHWLSSLQKDFIPYLFSKTDIRDYLPEFFYPAGNLREQINAARFAYLSSFAIEGELSQYLYYYGMYDKFYNHNSAVKANEIARGFTKLLYEANVDNVICFHTRSAWGKWFDIHSCTDNTFVFINKSARKIWLFCFSHSD